MTYKTKAEVKAEQQAKQGTQSNTAVLDRPVCDEIKDIYVSSMTSTYDACLEARNRGISAGLQKFRSENCTGNHDFFADWEVEAVQILESRSLNQNALPSSQVIIDLENLDQYPLEVLRDRNNYLNDLPSLDADQEHELEVLYAYLTECLESSNAVTA
jgi:hypothetical protein